ncbi:unnamed protein product, partial [Rotaria magnacalcarata]
STSIQFTVGSSSVILLNIFMIPSSIPGQFVLKILRYEVVSILLTIMCNGSVDGSA